MPSGSRREQVASSCWPGGGHCRLGLQRRHSHCAQAAPNAMVRRISGPDLLAGDRSRVCGRADRMSAPDGAATTQDSRTTTLVAGGRREVEHRGLPRHHHRGSPWLAHIRAAMSAISRMASSISNRRTDSDGKADAAHASERPRFSQGAPLRYRLVRRSESATATAGQIPQRRLRRRRKIGTRGRRECIARRSRGRACGRRARIR